MTPKIGFELTHNFPRTGCQISSSLPKFTVRPGLEVISLKAPNQTLKCQGTLKRAQSIKKCAEFNRTRNYINNFYDRRKIKHEI
jgi:hypothetical protein